MRVILFIGFIDFLLSIIAYLYYYKNLPLARTNTFLLLFILLAVNTAVARILPETLPGMLLKVSAWLSGVWIAFIYYSALLALGHLLIYGISKYIFSFSLPSAKLAVFGLCLIITDISWGCFRAFNPVIRTETISTSKLSTGEHYKIVLVSDIHLGKILGHAYAEQLVHNINQQQPDLVLFAGDILDERIKYVQEENSLLPFTKLQSTYGTYAALGNHDYLDDNLQWQKMLTENKIHILQNESIIFHKLKITGLTDYSQSRSSAALQKLAENNAAYYSIVIDHQPRRIYAATASGYDLYLAGHTHTGQLFPNRLVTKKMYPLDYGRQEFKQLTAITSSGYGFWGPPVRTEASPEIVVIELQGK